MVRRVLCSVIEADKHRALTEAIVRLRPEIEARIISAGLNDVVFQFSPDSFNPVSPLGSNLLYALPTSKLTQLSLAKNETFVTLLREKGLANQLMEMSATLIDTLRKTFGADGTDHPLFRRLNMEEDLYEQLGKVLANRRKTGDIGLPKEDYALMLTVPFAFSAEQFGPVFGDDLKDLILRIRGVHAKQMVDSLGGLFRTIEPDEYIPVMTVMGNAIFGRVLSIAGSREKNVEDIVVEVLKEHGLQRLLAESIYDVATTTGGENLPASFRERIAFTRACIKKPDILILRNSLASQDSETREQVRNGISKAMPESTKIFIENHFENPSAYDVFVELDGGRMVHHDSDTPFAKQTSSERSDLDIKIDSLAKTELFGAIDYEHLRLLAFSATWYHAEAGQRVFSVGENADAAYLSTQGRAGLFWHADESNRRMVSEVLPGRLIGDLSIITSEQRKLDLDAIEDSVFLRIGAEDLMAVVENDALLATALMKTVARNLNSVVDQTREMRNYSVARGVDFSELENQ